jgi:AhpD family alkylhydroperoxidase
MQRGGPSINHHAVLHELEEPAESLRRATPDVWSRFTALHEAAMADGAVPRHTKEAVALAISAIKRCDGCIARHAQAAERAGASPEEVAELLGVAVLMDGGTASVYAPRAWEAFNEFAAGRVAAAAR